MAYSDFTIDRLTQEFGVDFLGASLFEAAESSAPSAWLTETLALARRSGFGTDKARTERLVSPVLAELARRNQYEVAVISGESLDVAPERGLTGTCDFALSFTKVQDFINAPVCCIVGARTRENDNGVVECAAQLVGASLLHARDKKRSSPLYDCATTGVEWQFMKLEGNVCTLHEARYYTLDLPRLLGVLQHIVDRTKPHG
jgi:hypothetical protein